MHVSPNSRSLILRSTHVLLVQVMAAEELPWTPREGGGEERTVAIDIRLDEVIKGRVDQAPGESVRVEAKQVRLGQAWGPMPGIWSNAPIAAETRLAAFSIAETRDAVVLLNDPAGVELVAIGDALPDVHLAARASELSLEELLAAAREEAGSLGYLFADYLWAAYETEALDDFAAFDVILRALEWPELDNVARSTLLMSIPDAVLGVEPPATRHIDRLAVSMVRVLSMPAARTLHDNIAGTFLPNLIDAGNPESRPPARVFSEYPDDRARLADVARAFAGNESAAAFVAWANR